MTVIPLSEYQIEKPLLHFPVQISQKFHLQLLPPLVGTSLPVHLIGNLRRHFSARHSWNFPRPKPILHRQGNPESQSGKDFWLKMKVC